MGATFSRVARAAFGSSPRMPVLVPSESDEEGGKGVLSVGTQRFPHLGAALLWMLGLRGLLPSKISDHAACAAALAGIVYLGWRLLPEVSDAALLRSEALLLQNIKCPRRHRWTVVVTGHGVWMAHSIHMARPLVEGADGSADGAATGPDTTPRARVSDAGTGGTAAASEAEGVDNGLAPSGAGAGAGASGGAVAGAAGNASARSSGSAGATIEQGSTGAFLSSITPGRRSHTSGRHGPPNGHLLVIHGHSAGVGVWGKVIDGLQREGYQTHALDLPGWGRSVGPPVLETNHDPDAIIDMYVEFLEGWRIANNLHKVTVLAHSFGAFLTSHWARRHPDAIDHVMLVAPAGCFSLVAEDSYQGAIAFSLLTPQRFSKTMGRLGLGLFRVGNRLFADDLDEDMVDYYYQLAAASKRLPGAGDRACARFITLHGSSAVWNRPAVAVVLGLRQHVTLVFGANDPIVPARFGKLMRQMRPSGMNVFRVNDAAHNPAHCRPEVFCETMHQAMLLYEERVAQERLRQRRRAADLAAARRRHRRSSSVSSTGSATAAGKARTSAPRIIHAAQESVQPRCKGCGGVVRQMQESLVCDCGAVSFFATPWRKDTAARVLEMESTYRRLYVGDFSPAEVDPTLALITPRSKARRQRPKRHAYWWGGGSQLPSDEEDEADETLGRSPAVGGEAEAEGEGKETAARTPSRMSSLSENGSRSGTDDEDSYDGPPRRKLSNTMLRLHHHHTGAHLEK